MSISYSPSDVVVVQRNATQTAFIERVLTAAPNAFVSFDSASRLVAIPSQSISVISSSFSATSSYALQSISASYAPGSPSISASYALTASYALNGGSGGTTLTTGSTYPVTSSWAVSSSWASASATPTSVASASWVSASVRITTADTASFVAGANVNGTVSSASYAPQIDYSLVTGSIYEITASWSNNTISASYALTASFALNGGGSGTSLTTGSTYPITASVAISASYAPSNPSGSIYLPTSSSITFETSSLYSQSGKKGRVFWDEINNTLAVCVSNEVTQQVGLETYVRVHAKEDIANGQAVYYTGETSYNPAKDTYRPVVGLAIADGTGTKSFLAGVATQAIASGSRGFITVIGEINDLDTSALTTNTSVFLSNTVAGGLTTTRPLPPYEQIVVGICSRQDASEGILCLNIANPPDVSEFLSAGMTTLPTISGSVDSLYVSSGGTVNLYNTVTGNDRIHNYFLSAYTGSIPATGSTYYLVADYNSGLPVYNVLTSTDTINNTTITNVATIIRPIYKPNGIEYIFHDQFGYALSNKLNQRAIRTERYAHETGFVLAESASRVPTITAGAVWFGGSRITASAVNGAINTYRLFTTSTGSSTGWSSSVVTQYNNNQYDNGTGGLVTLSGAGTQYAVNFIFRSLAQGDNDLYSVLGRGNYSLAQAQASTVPSPLPAMLSPSAGLAVLVGRIIVAQAGTTATQIDSAWETTFQASAGTDHNALSNLQGGTAGEYYHLTSAQYTDLGISASYSSTSSLAISASYAPIPSDLDISSLTASGARIGNWIVSDRKINNYSSGDSTIDAGFYPLYLSASIIDVKTNTIITGSLDVTGNITAPNFIGTASFATNSISSSTALTASSLISYNTYTNDSNYERLNVSFTNNTASINLQNAGTGLGTHPLFINSNSGSLTLFSSGSVSLNTGNNTSRLAINSAGTITLGGSVSAASYNATFNLFQGGHTVNISNNGGLYVAQPATAGSIRFAGANALGGPLFIQIGSGSAQYPAIKMEISGTANPALSIRNGTDTAYADLVVKAITASVATFGNTSSYTSFEADGFMRFNGSASVFEDIRIEPTVRGTGLRNPPFEQYLTNGAGSQGLYLYSFADDIANSENEIYFTLQLPHAYKSGSNIHLHTHWMPAANSTPSTKTVVWGLEYSWAKIDGIFGTSTVVTASTPIIAETALTASKHYLTEFQDLVPTANQDSISSILMGRIFRNSSAAEDTYTNKVGLLYIDCHVEMDAFGSHDEFSK